MSEKTNALTVEERYKRVEQHEHILKIPDTYLGTVKTDYDKIYTFNEEADIITFEKKAVNEGLFKIFDEILVNASDNSIKFNSCNTIKVNINEDGSIEVFNNGETIPIAIHKIEGIYVPHMIFGTLLTSGNYEQTNKITGGKNGYGAKLTNIYSKYFEIEIVNVEYKKKYVQIFKNNMYEVDEPIITKSKEKESYTKIKFMPDYARFGMTTLTEDMKGLFKRRTYDLAGTTGRNMNIYYNNEIINIKNFEDYMKLYYENMPNYVYQTFNERWNVGIVFDTSKDHTAVSFVNRIATKEGGTHVQYIKDQLVEKIRDEIKKKHKTLTIKPATIADNLTLFINTTIEDPEFGSQSKEKLKTKMSDFKVPCILDDKFIKKICDMGVLEAILEVVEAKNENELKKKLDSSKNDNLRGIIKLDDAEWAGKAGKAHLCSLILTEGDSAKALAMSGRLDKQRYGIYPLKGKPLNVREATKKQLMENEEIINILKILGLKQGIQSFKKLRYGSVIIMADADVDGIHIGGLLINIFHFLYKDIIDINFIKRFITPVVRATKKTQMHDFYTMYEYEEWTKTVNPNLYNIKYYKGLGSWDRLQAVELFKDFENKLLTYNHGEINEENKRLTDEVILLGFSKKQTDERKEWVKRYDPSLSAVPVNNIITIRDYINKELIHFSSADNIRSIPDLCDGLKPSQRKVLFGVFDKNLEKNEIKVSQLAGYISERTEYHHGEASLLETIIGMAQNYWCSNNINLLMPLGQFGTRILGGKDSASPRYIFTKLNYLTKFIFKSDDNPILKYVMEDNIRVEPEKYYPVIPLCLINNVKGIGTGYSTEIPAYNPKDIINNIRLILTNKKCNELSPWTKFFIGEINKNTDKKNKKKSEFISRGKYRILDENTIEIYELPVGSWTSSYKIMLEHMINPKDGKEEDKSEFINHFTENHTDASVSFKLKFYNGKLQQLIKKNENRNEETDDVIETEFKLLSGISTNNMHLFHNNVITKFTNPNDVIKTYIPVRLEKYEERRLYIIDKLEREMLVLKYTKKYIEDVLNDIIEVKRQKKEVIHARLEELNYPKLSCNDTTPSYGYLTKLLIFDLTQEEIDNINKKYNDKQDEINYYSNITNRELWLKELDELEEQYDLWYNEELHNFGMEKVKIKKEKKGKKAN